MGLSSQSILATSAAPTTGSAFEPVSRHRTFQGSVTGTGAVSATIVIEVTNEADSANVVPSSTAQWVTAATITLSGTDSATDGFAGTSSWRFTRARCTAISGTGAAATCTMGVAR